MRTPLLALAAFWAVIIVVLVTQVIAPARRGLPLFPLFRPRNRKLEREIAHAREDQEAASAEKELAALRSALAAGATETATVGPTDAATTDVPLQQTRK